MQRCTRLRLGPSPHPHHRLPRVKAGDALLREGRGKELERDREGKLGKKITFCRQRHVPVADRGGCAHFAEI